MTPILTPVINVKEYAIELIGVVPKVDIIDKPTPIDIMNKPAKNRIILLIIILNRLTFNINKLWALTNALSMKF